MSNCPLQGVLEGEPFEIRLEALDNHEELLLTDAVSGRAGGDKARVLKVSHVSPQCLFLLGAGELPGKLLCVLCSVFYNSLRSFVRTTGDGSCWVISWTVNSCAPRQHGVHHCHSDWCFAWDAVRLEVLWSKSCPVSHLSCRRFRGNRNCSPEPGGFYSECNCKPHYIGVKDCETQQAKGGNKTK